jgi:hypothetical protein
MEPIVLFLRYDGSPAPMPHAPGVLTVKLAATSCAITTRIGDKNVSSEYRAIDGGTARAETVLTLTGEGVFLESGTIAFGDGTTWLRFNTVGQGFLGPSASKDVSAGCAVWRIVEGGGQFAGATGHVTGNFVVDAKGVAHDHQVAVIFPAA